VQKSRLSASALEHNLLTGTQPAQDTGRWV